MTSQQKHHPGHQAMRTKDGRPDYSLNAILTAASETAYFWDLPSDRMVWASNALEVLNVEDVGLMRTGAAVDRLIHEGLTGTRRETILASSRPPEGRCTPFSIQYRFKSPQDGEAIWLEDHGRWEANDAGEPIAARGVVRIITERYVREQHLDFLSRHDQLTGQFNRTELWEAISDCLMAKPEDGHTGNYALLLIGINNLLTINEAFGFDAGDEVIAAIAQRLRQQLRETDILSRFSSNKFGVLLDDTTPLAMSAAAERLLRTVRDQVIETSSGPISATVSIGGVLLPDHADNVSEAIGHAQEALAKAKAKPHDIFVAFEPGADKKEVRRRNREIVDELVSALREQRLLLALQPIVDAKTLEPVIHECLLRIRKPDGTIVSAGDCIPIAEQLGLIRLLDFRVLELAVDVAKRRPELRITVNVSGLTTADAAWLGLLASLIDGDESLSRRLIIEITETAALQEFDESCAFVRHVKELGCKVAMDDFGTGYNSFRNLQLLGLDMVKIDGSFIENVLRNKDDQLFVKMLADLANQFGLEVVAENVGDEETADMLRKWQITYLQGYHFGEPVPAFPPRRRDTEADGMTG